MNPVHPHARPRTHFRLSPRHERWVLATSSVLALSGIAWLLSHYFLAEPNEFGPPRHPLERWWLGLHGGAAMAFLIVFGSVIPVHAPRARRARLNHRSGLTVVGIVALLVLTGFGLYYVGSEALRPWLSLGHWLIGIVGVPITPDRTSNGHSPSIPAICSTTSLGS